MFDFQGRCKHVMVTDKCAENLSTEEKIHIEVNSMSCGSQDVTCAKEIIAKIYGTTFILKKGTKKAEIVSSEESISDYEVYNFAGSYVHIITNHGLSLMWDNGTRLYITADSKLSGKLCGLCGNFDGNEANDFVTFQGDLTGSSLTFGNSWKTDESCPKAKEVLDTCKARPHRLDSAKRKCSILQSVKFKACHSLVSVTPYYDRCVFDACGCDLLGGDDCLCGAVGAYQKECQNEGVFVGWRVGHDICGKFFLF